MTGDPRYLSEFAALCAEIGADELRKQYPSPMLVGMGMRGEVQDRARGDMRSTMQANNAAELHETMAMRFRVLPIRKGAGGKPGAKITMGRNADNDIVLAEYSLSGNHCAFMYDATRAAIIDLNSRNGTMVNKTPIPPNRSVQLPDRATITVGRLQFRFMMPKTFTIMVKSMPPL